MTTFEVLTGSDEHVGYVVALDAEDAEERAEELFPEVAEFHVQRAEDESAEDRENDDACDPMGHGEPRWG